MVKRRRTFAKCALISAVPVHRNQEFDPLTDYPRVDTCTGLLPEKKPRYVMGVVRVIP